MEQNPESTTGMPKARFECEPVTESHRAAGDTLHTVGQLFFSNERYLVPGLKLRLFPLIVGPTGAGKTFLVRSAAKRLRARYLKVTRSDWIPQGSATGRPTMYQILDYVITQPRVLLHLDELDKYRISFSGPEWSAAIAGNLWSVLDGALPVLEYLRDTPNSSEKNVTEAKINSWIQSRLWVVGSGTWQSVFKENRAGSAIGFAGAHENTPVTADAIARSELISPELLHRFCSDLIFLKYPNHHEETARLLESTGISALASELGETITAQNVNFELGGMRVLESIATRLVIARHRRRMNASPRAIPLGPIPGFGGEDNSGGSRFEP
jgi:hypothetical protein